MRMKSAFAMLAALVLLAAGPVSAQGFKFEQPGASDAAAKAEEAAKQDRIAYELSTPCRADLKGKKIMVIIGEQQSNGYVCAQQQNYGPHYQAINSRLRCARPAHLSRRRRSAAQIAQAEIDAYFKNDPDARAVGREAARRELRPARADLVAGDPQHPIIARQPGHGEHGLHADRQQRPDHLGRRCELELVFGRGRCHRWR